MVKKLNTESKPKKPRSPRRERRIYCSGKLKPTELNVFKTDAANKFTLTSQQIADVLGLKYSYIAQIRAAPNYKWHIQQYHIDALDVLQDARNKASKVMLDLLDTKDEELRFRVAQEVLAPTLEGLKKAAQLKALSDAMGANVDESQPGEIVYKAQWGSTEEPAGPALDPGAGNESNPS